MRPRRRRRRRRRKHRGACPAVVSAPAAAAFTRAASAGRGLLTLVCVSAVPGGMPGGMPGGAGGMDDMMKVLFSDPEVVALMSQPGVGEAIQEIMSDPQGGLAKHQGNPAVMAAFQK